MAIWHQTPVTRLRAGSTSDGYGNSSPDWTTPTEAEFLVKWSPKSVSEVIGDEPQTVSRVKISGGPELDLRASDRITGPDGNTYEVDGEVERHYGPAGLHHIGAMLRRIAITGS